MNRDEVFSAEPGAWETLSALLSSMFGPMSDEATSDQLFYFLGWWKHALEGVRDGHDVRGLCLVLVGDPCSGKSLLKQLIAHSLGSSIADPLPSMSACKIFNGELKESRLWAVDDSVAEMSDEARHRFGLNLKTAVADTTYPIRPMYQEGGNLKLYRRVMICAGSAERLPFSLPLTPDLADKVMILRTQQLEHSELLPLHDSTRLWAQFVAELPHLVHWLLHEYEIEPDLEGRFGVKSFCCPALLPAEGVAR